MDLPDQAIQEYEDRIQTAHHRKRFCFANRDKSQSCVCVSCRQPRQFKTKDHHFVLLPVYFESRALRNRLLQKVSDKTLSEEEFEAGGEPEGKIGTERDYKQSTPVKKLYQKRQVYRDPGVLRSIKVAGSSELHKKPVVYESPEISKGSVTPMAPAFSRSGARSGRVNRNTGFDHDIVEGLPIRHWRRDNVTVAPPPHPDLLAQQNDKWAIELPHGMPKDSHLLPSHSRELLRAARSGRLYKRPSPEDEETESTEILGEKVEKLEKKEEEIEVKGFTAKTWKQTPKHLEGAEFEYLAPRRPGLINPSKASIGAGAGAPEPALTKATVRRTDATGNVVVEDMVLKEGDYVLGGEIIAQTVIPGSSVAPETPAAVATPVRRKPPPPKRKAKGPGRGRKKKVQIVEGANGTGAAVANSQQNSGIGENGVKTEISSQNGIGGNGDTEMGGEGENQSDDEEGDESGDDDEEGGDETPNPGLNPSTSHSATPVAQAQTPILPSQLAPAPTAEEAQPQAETNTPQQPTPPVTARESPIFQPLQLEDSIMQDSEPTLPVVSQPPETEALSALETVVEEQPNPTTVALEKDQDVMLLDADTSNFEEQQLQESQEPQEPHEPQEPQELHEPQESAAATAQETPQQVPEPIEAPQTVPEPTALNTEASEVADDDDGFVDLLGGLERNLAENDVQKNASEFDTKVEDASEPAPAPVDELAPAAEPELTVDLQEESSPAPEVPTTTSIVDVPPIEESSDPTPDVAAEPEKPVEVVEAVEDTAKPEDAAPAITAEPAVEPVQSPVKSAEPRVEVAVEAVIETAPVPKSAPEPVQEPAPGPAPGPVPEPVPELVSEPVQEPAPEPVALKPAEPVKEVSAVITPVETFPLPKRPADPVEPLPVSAPESKPEPEAAPAAEISAEPEVAKEEQKEEEKKEEPAAEA